MTNSSWVNCLLFIGDCPAGSYSTSWGAKACEICPSGTQLNASTSICHACAAGSYLDANEQVWHAFPLWDFLNVGRAAFYFCVFFFSRIYVPHSDIHVDVNFVFRNAWSALKVRLAPHKQSVARLVADSMFFSFICYIHFASFNLIWGSSLCFCCTLSIQCAALLMLHCADMSEWFLCNCISNGLCAMRQWPGLFGWPSGSETRILVSFFAFFSVKFPWVRVFSLFLSFLRFYFLFSSFGFVELLLPNFVLRYAYAPSLFWNYWI